MNSISHLQHALSQLEDHLFRAGAALIKAEQDSEAADVTRMLHAFGWRYKQQVAFLREHGELERELYGNAPKA